MLWGLNVQVTAVRLQFIALYVVVLLFEVLQSSQHAVTDNCPTWIRGRDQENSLRNCFITNLRKHYVAGRGFKLVKLATLGSDRFIKSDPLKQGNQMGYERSRLGFIESVHEQQWLIIQTGHTHSQIFQGCYIFGITENELIDPKGPENIIYSMMKYGETF